MGNVMLYSGIVTKVRAMQAKLLKDEDFENIAGLRSIPAAVEYLKGKPAYAEALGRMDETLYHRGNVEKVLGQSLFADYSRIYQFAGMKQKQFLKGFWKQYEISLINYCLRIVFNHYDTPFDLDYKKEYFDRFSQISIDKLVTSENIRELVENLQADGALPGDDVRVVEGVGEGVALLPAEALSLLSRVVVHAGDQHHPGAVALRGLHLADRGPGGHADDGGDAQPGGGKGDALGVVPGGAGDDAPLRLLFGEGADFVEGPPELEGAGELQILRLDVKVPAQLRGGVQRRLAGDALQRLLRVSYHVQGQHR